MNVTSGVQWGVQYRLPNGHLSPIATATDYGDAVRNAKTYHRIQELAGGEVLKRTPGHNWEVVHVYPLPVRDYPTPWS